MNRLQRTLVSVAILLNLFGFGVVFLVLTNGEEIEDLIYYSATDIQFISIVAIAGIVANLLLIYALIRLGLARRRYLQENASDESRERITGE